jgi:HEPN domain-containing protein
MRPEAQAWWTEAQSELVGARHLLQSNDYHLCAFFCQQSVEKALKAVWIHQRKELQPKTHDLIELSEPLGVPDGLQTRLKSLNPLFVTTRYPDAANGNPSLMYDEAIAEECLSDAEEVISWCRSQLEQS